jgi:hypothetical protein
METGLHQPSIFYVIGNQGTASEKYAEKTVKAPVRSVVGSKFMLEELRRIIRENKDVSICENPS